MAFRSGIMWKNLGHPVRLGPLDGRAAVLIALAAYHWSLWTLGLAVLGMLGLLLVERFGYTIPNLSRRIGVLLVGTHRPAKSYRIMSRCDN